MFVTRIDHFFGRNWPIWPLIGHGFRALVRLLGRVRKVDNVKHIVCHTNRPANGHFLPKVVLKQFEDKFTISGF